MLLPESSKSLTFSTSPRLEKMVKETYDLFIREEWSLDMAMSKAGFTNYVISRKCRNQHPMIRYMVQVSRKRHAEKIKRRGSS